MNARGLEICFGFRKSHKLFGSLYNHDKANDFTDCVWFDIGTNHVVPCNKVTTEGRVYFTIS